MAFILFVFAWKPFVFNGKDSRRTSVLPESDQS